MSRRYAVDVTVGKQARTIGPFSSRADADTEAAKWDAVPDHFALVLPMLAPGEWKPGQPVPPVHIEGATRTRKPRDYTTGTGMSGPAIELAGKLEHPFQRALDEDPMLEAHLAMKAAGL